MRRLCFFFLHGQDDQIAPVLPGWRLEMGYIFGITLLLYNARRMLLALLGLTLGL